MENKIPACDIDMSEATGLRLLCNNVHQAFEVIDDIIAFRQRSIPSSAYVLQLHQISYINKDNLLSKNVL
jgi:hypothetical protein